MKNNHEAPLVAEALRGQLRFDENDQSRQLLKETIKQDTNERNKTNIKKGSVQSDGYILVPDIPKYDTDPDAGDMLVQLDWQKHHQRFYDTLKANMSQKMHKPDLGTDYFDFKYGEKVAFPLGTIAYYKCVIDRDLHIQSLEITKSSGIELYDQLLLESIRELEKQEINGKPVLQFPERSRRTQAVEEGNLQHVRRIDTYQAPHDIESYKTKAPKP